MAVWTVKAKYTPQVLPEYQGNGLIEALPDILSASDTMHLLTRKPRYDESERELDAKYRIHCLSRLLHEYYQPLPQHFDIETRISVCIRQGYLNRNPIERQYALMANEAYEAMKEKRPVRPVPGYHPNASGFTIIDVSGVGKSTAVESVLSLYPQVIRHSQYHGEPMPVTQIVWLNVCFEDIDYQLIPATYALLHLPERVMGNANVYSDRYFLLSKDIAWLLKNGFMVADN